jgi:hypothetical protein
MCRTLVAIAEIIYHKKDNTKGGIKWAEFEKLYYKTRAVIRKERTLGAYKPGTYESNELTLLRARLFTSKFFLNEKEDDWRGSKIKLWQMRAGDHEDNEEDIDEEEQEMRQIEEQYDFY